MKFIEKNLPEYLEALLKEESKGSRLQIPKRLRDRLPKIQSLYKELYGEKLTRENAILLMVADVIADFEIELEKAIELTAIGTPN